MNKIVFASHNIHKVSEIQHSIEKWDIVSLKDLDYADDIPETGSTLRENALQKAQFVYDKFGYNCFADDTGLEIDFLNGEPGVFSARYAGENCSFEDNTNKVLEKLKSVPMEKRTARFKTTICLIFEGEKYFFDGEVEGHICEEKSGEMGFGYDPIFKPINYNITFAEMDLDLKNKISHRAIASAKLVEFLNQK
ncbi:MAG: RdgB/HAM1 family non-canonical purine NTP pyrophosphatase [Bacteroidales bacterium]|jgi:XTP/dITP diphosphohydrolase|nr:RdgB/HAM1 family non-canonical purine NTP pyrophosphatase [Bacteroidales bacterium]